MKFSDIPAHEDIKALLSMIIDSPMRCYLKARRVSGNLLLQEHWLNISIVKTEGMETHVGFVRRADSISLSIKLIPFILSLY